MSASGRGASWQADANAAPIYVSGLERPSCGRFIPARALSGYESNAGPAELDPVSKFTTPAFVIRTTRIICQ